MKQTVTCTTPDQMKQNKVILFKEDMENIEGFLQSKNIHTYKILNLFKIAHVSLDENETRDLLKEDCIESIETVKYAHTC